MAAKNVFDGLNISEGFNWNQATTLVWQEPILDSRARVLTELRYISFQNRVSVDKVSVVVWLPVHFIKRFALSSETTPAAIIIKVKWISTSLAFDHYKKPNQSSFSWQQSYKKRGTVFQNDQNWNRQKGSFCTWACVTGERSAANLRVPKYCVHEVQTIIRKCLSCVRGYWGEKRIVPKNWAIAVLDNQWYRQKPGVTQQARHARTK